MSLQHLQADPRLCADRGASAAVMQAPWLRVYLSKSFLPEEVGHARFAHSCKDVLSWQQRGALHTSLLEAQPFTGQHAATSFRLDPQETEHCCLLSAVDVLLERDVICCICFDVSPAGDCCKRQTWYEDDHLRVLEGSVVMPSPADAIVVQLEVSERDMSGWEGYLPTSRLHCRLLISAMLDAYT